MKIPTDLELLQTIYDTYYTAFADFSPRTRHTRNYLPIDCTVIGKKLDLHPAIVFGRLYYVMQEKYGFVRKEEPGGDPLPARVPFFSKDDFNEPDSIHFPMLASVLAAMQEEHRKYTWTLLLAGFAALFTFLSLLK